MQEEKRLQAEALDDEPYNAAVPRKLSKPRPRQGAHLVRLRQAAGLSQVELARLIGESQQNIAYWEKSDKPPRSDVLPKLAEVLGVRLDQLLVDSPVRSSPSSPVGMVRKVFTDVSKLPRRQQQKIVDVVSALVEQYKRKAS